MDVRLWIDDLRPAPVGWVWVKSSTEALALLDRWQTSHQTLAAVSFDYDLGGDDTSMPVMDWFITHKRWPNTIFVHTANPAGRRNLLMAADRYADAHVEIVQIWQDQKGNMPDM